MKSHFNPGFSKSRVRKVRPGVRRKIVDRPLRSNQNVGSPVSPIVVVPKAA